MTGNNNYTQIEQDPVTDKQTIKQWFKNGAKPVQENFWNWLDSFWHKNEKIPVSSIHQLDNLLHLKADKEQLEAHKTDTKAHPELFERKVDKVAGKGLSTHDFTTEYRDKLNGLIIPENRTNGGKDLEIKTECNYHNYFIESGEKQIIINDENLNGFVMCSVITMDNATATITGNATIESANGMTVPSNVEIKIYKLPNGTIKIIGDTIDKK